MELTTVEERRSAIERNLQDRRILLERVETIRDGAEQSVRDLKSEIADLQYDLDCLDDEECDDECCNPQDTCDECGAPVDIFGDFDETRV